MPWPIRRPRPPQERAARVAAWSRWFSGASSYRDYRRALVEATGLPESLAWELTGDLTEPLVERVPASLGVPAVLALVAFLHGHPKATEACRALLSAILEELDPAHARTVLETLALAWQEAHSSFQASERRRIISERLGSTVRRLAASGAEGIDTVRALLAVLDDRPEADGAILEGT